MGQFVPEWVGHFVRILQPEVDLTVEAQEFITKEVDKAKKREHRFIQEYVKKIAAERNFKAVIEEPVNDNTGSVDVGLHRDDLKIACEISVTNTAKYEVQNIQKCLTAGYSLIFMISNDPKHLSDIREMTILKVDQPLHNRLYFVSKDDFVNQLDKLLARKPPSTEMRAKGYRVKIKYRESSDTSEQEKTLKNVILSSIRRQNKQID